MPDAATVDLDNYGKLGVRVDNLEREIGEVNSRIGGLDSKLDRNQATLAAKIDTISSQKPQWAVMIAGAGLIISVLGLFGSQALAPVQSDIKGLKASSVPRAEVEYRDAAHDRRLADAEAELRAIRERREIDLQKQIDRLEAAARAATRRDAP
jgi:hypothetical protein